MSDDSDSQNPFADVAAKAATETNEELSGAEAKLASVSWDEIKKMLPNPLDQQQLNELIKIVQGATDHNVKVASLISNISKVGSVVVKVLSQVR